MEVVVLIKTGLRHVVGWAIFCLFLDVILDG